MRSIAGASRSRLGSSATAQPVGKPFTMSDPCFLIRHSRGTLLWDHRLTWTIERTNRALPNMVGREFIDVSLTDQLKMLSLSPADITFIGISHMQPITWGT